MKPQTGYIETRLKRYSSSTVPVSVDAMTCVLCGALVVEEGVALHDSFHRKIREGETK